jgi:hypothetical protein
VVDSPHHAIRKEREGDVLDPADQEIEVPELKVIIFLKGNQMVHKPSSNIGSKIEKGKSYD